MSRPTWDEYFMDMAFLVRRRSTCLRREVGAIAVRDKNVLSTGYNGAPKGMLHCLEKGCLRKELNVPSGEKHELCRGVHAEENVVAQAAYHGVSLKGATLFVTTMPCVICVKLLINAGIVKIVYAEPYDDKMAEELLEEAKIELVQFKKEARDEDS